MSILTLTEENFKNTPFSNTGFNGKTALCKGLGDNSQALPERMPSGLIQVGIDWLQGVFICPRDYLEAAIECILGYSHGQAIWKTGQGRFMGHYWENTIESTCGAKFYWSFTKESPDHVRVWMGLSGSCMARIPVKRQVQLLANLAEGGGGLWGSFGATRIDPKIRISSDLLSLDAVEVAGLDGNFAGCSPESFRRNISGTGERLSKTLYFGSTQSDCMTRFYDPLENHGVIGAVDIESQLKDAKAQEFLSYFVGDYKLLLGDFDEYDYLQIIATVAVGQVKFIDRASADRPCRCQVLPFWQRVLDLMGGALKVIAIREVKTFERAIKWIKRQVVPTLAAMTEAWGEKVYTWIKDSIEYILSQGLSYEHQALVDEVKELNQTFPCFK